jgi:excisionase family DNA binding protein
MMGANANLAKRRESPASERLALSPDEAAACLGVSRDFFDEHVGPELRIVRRGRRRLIPVRELERWLVSEAALRVGGELRGGDDDR